MIEFEHRLPSLNIDGRHNGTYNNHELGMPSVLTTTDHRLGDFLYELRRVVTDDRRLVLVDGRILMCSINWIRDHVHQMKAFKHWEYNLGSFLNFILDTQSEEGFFYELIKQMDDYHWKFVNEDCRVLYPEDNVALVRLEIEADVEYLVVEGAVEYYQVTGDDAWLARALPKLEKAIDYMTSSPKRWDAAHGLVKRAFTIDTWDFAYGRPNDNRRIEDCTPMSIMHGDNSGVYQAMRQLAWCRRRFGDEERAAEWDARAERLRENMFRWLWNGRFFIHQLHLGHAGADEHENERLSLSNGYDINRGVTGTEQSRAIIGEYLRRKESSGCFAEWFSIDPPYYPDFNGHPANTYVNGSISPFTAGELAKAAFRSGYEEYGWDIVCRCMDMMERDGTICFLYTREDAKPVSVGSGPSGWGAAALLSAVDEGLAGIVDLDVQYRVIGFSPRFPVTGYEELRYVTGYESQNLLVDLRYILKEDGMRYDLYSPAHEIHAHVLLPRGKVCQRLLVNGRDAAFTLSEVGGSVYADFTAAADGKVSMELLF